MGGKQRVAAFSRPVEPRSSLGLRANRAGVGSREPGIQRMELHLLGPIEARLGDRRLHLGARKQRAVLAMLGLEVNRTVSSDRLVEGLWGSGAAAERAEDGAALRLAAAPAARRRRRRRSSPTAAAMSCCLPADAVDVARFERLVRASRAPARGARAVARRGARRRRRRAVRRRGDPPARRAAAARARAGDRRRPRRGPPCRRDRRARRSSSRSIRCASGCTRSGCWRCTARGASPRRWRPTGTRAPRWWTRIGVEPGPELRRLQSAILDARPRARPARAAPPPARPRGRHRRRRRRRRACVAAAARGRWPPRA